MKYLKLFEDFINEGFNYDYIVKSLVRENGWGNTISDLMPDFEKSDYFKTVSDDHSYIIEFNRYLMMLGHDTENRENLPVAEPISWYSKLS